jgi:hypothetical protein
MAPPKQFLENRQPETEHPHQDLQERNPPAAGLDYHRAANESSVNCKERKKYTDLIPGAQQREDQNEARMRKIQESFLTTKRNRAPMNLLHTLNQSNTREGGKGGRQKRIRGVTLLWMGFYGGGAGEQRGRGSGDGGATGFFFYFDPF